MLVVLHFALEMIHKHLHDDLIIVAYILSIVKKDVIYWINALHLEEHPEGGYFVDSYQSEKFVSLPEYSGRRHACTAIYYLLEGEDFSSFHRLKSDELWHFYAGSSLTLHIIEKEGGLNEVKLGANFDNKEIFQAVMKSGSWFAASVNEHNSYSLVGCTTSPGFDYDDWELADINTLKKMYPQHKSTIEKYTKPISST
jgi:predicted cupin superfamily sugar epimerase